MDRRRFIRRLLLGLGTSLAGGCRGKQFARVKAPGEADMVGSHAAGSETFKPLVDEAVANLLGRHCPSMPPPGTLPPPPKRICFVCVENKSAEEIGDFKDQIYQIIDTKIVESHMFQPVNKRFVDAGLVQTRLRPDQLFVPQNMRAFSTVLEQQGQPFDYVLYATLTSGTTHANQNTQRDYVLTMEMVDVRSGDYDKQAATLTKGYYHSRVGKLASFMKG
jgi:peptidoglycan-synthase activator LpoB